MQFTVRERVLSGSCVNKLRKHNFLNYRYKTETHCKIPVIYTKEFFCQTCGVALHVLRIETRRFENLIFTRLSL